MGTMSFVERAVAVYAFLDELEKRDLRDSRIREQ